MMNNDRPVVPYQSTLLNDMRSRFNVPLVAGEAMGALHLYQQQGQHYYGDGTEAVPYDPALDFMDEDKLRSWADESLSEHEQLKHHRIQERYYKDCFLRDCAIQLGEAPFSQANPVLAGLSGAQPDELEQEIVILGLNGELCRINRPARALTVRGDSRKQDDLPWIIMRTEEETKIPREQIRLTHEGVELTAPAYLRGNTDFRLSGRLVYLSLFKRTTELVEFHNYYWRLQNVDRRHILGKYLEEVLSRREHKILQQELSGLETDQWSGMIRINPDHFYWSAESRARFDVVAAAGLATIQGDGGLSVLELRMLIQNLISEDGHDGEVLYLLDNERMLLQEVKARINREGMHWKFPPERQLEFATAEFNVAQQEQHLARRTWLEKLEDIAQWRAIRDEMTRMIAALGAQAPPEPETPAATAVTAEPPEGDFMPTAQEVEIGITSYSGREQLRLVEAHLTGHGGPHRDGAFGHEAWDRREVGYAGEDDMQRGPRSFYPQGLGPAPAAGANAPGDRRNEHWNMHPESNCLNVFGSGPQGRRVYPFMSLSNNEFWKSLRFPPIRNYVKEAKQARYIKRRGTVCPRDATWSTRPGLHLYSQTPFAAT